jgi:Ubiquitin carboxyl-terminal hydrolase
MGGHYYAFIKDVEASDQLRDKWHNFNDYRVSECDLVDIAEMFGGNKGKGVAQTTNAYMLMYRLCKSLN